MIYILKTPLSPVNGEKEEKHFHGNGHLCTSTCTTLIILLDSVAKKPHLQLISGSILGMKVLFFSFILQLAIIMNNEAFAFSNVTIYAGFHGRTGGEPLYCFGNIKRITEICLEFIIFILQVMLEFSIVGESVPIPVCQNVTV